jgi:hypothetical protein
MSAQAIGSYAALLDDLLARRRAAPNHELDEVLEATFASAMNDCRKDMTPDEEASIDAIVQDRIAREASR